MAETFNSVVIQDGANDNIREIWDIIKHLESLEDTGKGGGGGLTLRILQKTANYTFVDTDFKVVADATGGSFTITLPTAASAFDSVNNIGQIYNVIKNDSSANTVTLQGNGVETINGFNTQVIWMQYDDITVQSDGTEWWII